MYGIPIYKLLGWKDWLKIAGGLLVVVASAVLFVMVFSGESTTEAAIDMDTERLEKELKAANERSDAIEQELEALRFEVEEVRYEIQESIQQREEMHDALDNAVTIDGVNDLLRKRRRRGN